MLSLLTTLLVAPPLTAPPAALDTVRTVSGVSMSETIDVAGQQLTLNGMAVRKKFVVKVYVAGLYVATKSSSADEILSADAPRRMVMHFVHDVDQKKICEGWTDGLAKNTPEASADLKQQFQELCGMMTDIKKGQAFTFTYDPAAGTTVDVVGTTAGTLAGKDFADALLRCWIGPKPGPGEGFKKNLLGQS